MGYEAKADCPMCDLPMDLLFGLFAGKDYSAWRCQPCGLEASLLWMEMFQAGDEECVEFASHMANDDDC